MFISLFKLHVDVNIHVNVFFLMFNVNIKSIFYLHTSWALPFKRQKIKFSNRHSSSKKTDNCQCLMSVVCNWRVHRWAYVGFMLLGSKVI